MNSHWTSVPPCPHPHLWMTNSRECAACWMQRVAGPQTTAQDAPRRSKSRKEA
jgi:hypothetical protein